MSVQAHASEADGAVSQSKASSVSQDKSEEGPGDALNLHPSVRFYRGAWRLTQLSCQPTNSHEKSADTVETDASLRQAVAPGGTDKATLDMPVLSVVALHQRLLPPAPVNGLGEIADESYAVQLALPDGIDFLREHWHVLLPLLFPRVRGAPVSTDSSSSSEAALAPTDDAAGSSNKRRNEEGEAGDSHDNDKEEEEEPESSWSVWTLQSRVNCALSPADLKVVREPGLLDRIYYSYIVLLRFYGWRVHDEERGLLDRNRAWAERYAVLQQFRTHPMSPGGAAVEESPHTAFSELHARLPPPPSYASFDFYADGLPRVLRCLLDVGFLRLGVRLVEFVMEEIKSGRLLFLLPLVEETLLPMVVDDENVEASHKARLKKQLFRLTHSDSD